MIKTFLEVMDAGNFNKAAQRLHVTQSTITMRINALEEQLGQQLMVRSKTGAQLTSAGFKFQRHAEMLVQVWNQARQEVELSKNFDSSCNIGCHYNLWEGAAQDWFDLIKDLSPNTALSSWCSDHTDLNRWLNSGMIDISIAFDTQLDINSSYETRPLFTDKIVRVSTQPDVGEEDANYVYVDHGNNFRREHAIDYPMNETTAITMSNSQWGLNYILRNGGSAYLPYRMVSELLENKCLFLIDTARKYNHTCYVSYNIHAVKNWPWFEASLTQMQGKLLSAYQMLSE